MLLVIFDRWILLNEHFLCVSSFPRIEKWHWIWQFIYVSQKIGQRSTAIDLFVLSEYLQDLGPCRHYVHPAVTQSTDCFGLCWTDQDTQCIYLEGMQGYYSCMHTLGRFIHLGINSHAHLPIQILKSGSHMINISLKVFDASLMLSTSTNLNR